MFYVPTEREPSLFIFSQLLLNIHISFCSVYISIFFSYSPLPPTLFYSHSMFSLASCFLLFHIPFHQSAQPRLTDGFSIWSSTHRPYHHLLLVRVRHFATPGKRVVLRPRSFLKRAQRCGILPRSNPFLSPRSHNTAST